MAKRILIWMIVGGFVGDAVTSWFGPGLLNYWFRPPGVTDQDRCVAQVSAAMSELVKLQLYGAGVGLVLFLVLGIFWYRRPSERRADPSAPSR